VQIKNIITSEIFFKLKYIQIPKNVHQKKTFAKKVGKKLIPSKKLIKCEKIDANPEVKKPL
jgi:hypothetical protein